MQIISRDNNFKMMSTNQSNNIANETDNLTELIRKVFKEEREKMEQEQQEKIAEQVKQEVQKESLKMLTQKDLKELNKNFQKVINQQTQLINLLSTTKTDENGNKVTYNYLNLIYRRLQKSSENYSKNNKINVTNVNSNLMNWTYAQDALTNTMLNILTTIDPEAAKQARKEVNEIYQKQTEAMNKKR